MPETFLDKAQLSGLTRDARRTEILRAKNLNALQAQVDDLPLGVIGYATRTTVTSALTVNPTDISVSVSWTAPAGRLYRLSAATFAYGNTSGDIAGLNIATGGGTVLQRANILLPGGGNAVSTSTFCTYAPSAGSVTIKLQGILSLGSGTNYLYGQSTFPIYLLVEDIGLA